MMKWYPFWKIWYFSREQRLGIGLMVILILFIIVVKNPILNHLDHKNEKTIAIKSEQKWQTLNAQIDSSKALAKKERDSIQKIKYSKKYSYNKDSTKKKEYSNYSKPDYSKIIVELNQSEPKDLIKIRGIGAVLSGRIIKYRTILGGFYKIDQVAEVYGISDSLYQSIKKNLKVSPTKIQKLDINLENVEKLKSHPYISDKLAYQIINYREKVKTFDSVEEVKKLYIMNDSIYNKLYPYLTIY